MKPRGVKASAVLLLVLGALAFGGDLPGARAQAPAASREAGREQNYAVEYYYKVSWGHADEWLRLFKKNHLPLLKVLQSQGAIVDLKIQKPLFHTTEDGRWDYRVTITYKDIAASQGTGGDQSILLKLFPDQATYEREEQRRFEILIAHWDLPVEEVSQEP